MTKVGGKIRRISRRMRGFWEKGLVFLEECAWGGEKGAYFSKILRAAGFRDTGAPATGNRPWVAGVLGGRIGLIERPQVADLDF